MLNARANGNPAIFPGFLVSGYPETEFGHWQISNSEMGHFLQDQGNQRIRRRRTIVLRTTNPAD